MYTIETLWSHTVMGLCGLGLLAIVVLGICSIHVQEHPATPFELQYTVRLDSNTKQVCTEESTTPAVNAVPVGVPIGNGLYINQESTCIHYQTQYCTQWVSAGMLARPNIRRLYCAQYQPK